MINVRGDVVFKTSLKGKALQDLITILEGVEFIEFDAFVYDEENSPSTVECSFVTEAENASVNVINYHYSPMYYSRSYEQWYPAECDYELEFDFDAEEVADDIRNEIKECNNLVSDIEIKFKSLYGESDDIEFDESLTDEFKYAS